MMIDTCQGFRLRRLPEHGEGLLQLRPEAEAKPRSRQLHQLREDSSAIGIFLFFGVSGFGSVRRLEGVVFGADGEFWGHSGGILRKENG